MRKMIKIEEKINTIAIQELEKRGFKFDGRHLDEDSYTGITVDVNCKLDSRGVRLYGYFPIAPIMEAAGIEGTPKYKSVFICEADYNEKGIVKYAIKDVESDEDEIIKKIDEYRYKVCQELLKILTVEWLKELGWKKEWGSEPLDSDDLWLTQTFDVTHAKELPNYIDYQPQEGEILYCNYRINPNRQVCEWAIWREGENPGNVIYEGDDFWNTLEDALSGDFFTYPHWLEQIADENNTTLYAIARDGGLTSTVPYKIVERNTKFGDVTLNTHAAIAKGLGLTLVKYLDKYFDTFINE
jgi:hypothetical protein